jgi:hypothetical protein
MLIFRRYFTDIDFPVCGNRYEKGREVIGQAF